MAFSASSSSPSANPNVTPLIDVLLVLLIIFMVIVPNAPHGLESLVPQVSSASAQASPTAPLILQVDGAGRGNPILYRLDRKVVTLPELRVRLRQAQAESAQRSLFISGDPHLDYQPVVSAISEAHQAGFQSIGLLTRASQSAY